MSETDRRPEGRCLEKNQREESKNDHRAKIFVNPKELILIPFSLTVEEKKIRKLHMYVCSFILFIWIYTYVRGMLVLVLLVLVAVPLFILEDKLLYTYILRTAFSLLLVLEALYLQ